jgi:hypothetical protein
MWREEMRSESQMRCQQVRSEMRSQVRTKMRREEIMPTLQARTNAKLTTLKSAGLRLLQIYSELAKNYEHLLGELLEGQPPRQWEHYPHDDAMDSSSGYQWFYHSHSPEDRPGCPEHGHIHLFARRSLWSRRLQSHAEAEFQRICGSPKVQTHTRHLLAIGLNAKGVPISLFTVNSWVTGDLMLNKKLTMELLAAIRLNTGHPKVDAVLESVIHLCYPEIQELMAQRDTRLASYPGVYKLRSKKLEMLSELSIDLDEKLKRLL